MRILLVAEGEHELHGALETLVKRLLPAGVAASSIDKLKISDGKIGHISSGGDRLTKRILFALSFATRLGYDALVLVIDEDGYQDRRRSINQAQNSTLFPLQRAIGIAIQAFDAWMLADEKAISTTLGRPINCQPAPEELSRPKDFFRALHRDAPHPPSLREVYAQIAEIADLELLLKRCPDGFGRFTQRVRALR
jgi:hypothetical protein